MNEADQDSPAQPGEGRRGATALEWVAGLITAALGLKYGYDFGERLNGVLLGVITAVSTGLFGFLVASSLVERLLGLAGGKRDRA